MRIACIAASRVPSRTANSIQVMKVCQAFLDLGHEVRLWLPGRPSDMPWDRIAEQYGIRDRIPITWLREPPGLRRYGFSLRAVLAGRAWQPDLFYVWPLQAAALASRLGLPSVMEIHDRPQGHLGPRLMHAFLQGAGRRRLLPITHAMQSWLEEAYAEARSVSSVVSPMAADLAPYEGLPAPDLARRKLGLTPGFTAGYTGHLYPGRGLGLLAELAKLNPDVAFVWAGGEAHAIEGWRARLATEGVHNVVLMGFVPQSRVPLVQAACEVLLMPYEREIAGSSGGDTAMFASPMKSFEYLAAGRAILASDLPVLREVLAEGAALLLPPDDVEAWNNALRGLRAEAGLRERLGSEARREARRHTWTERQRAALAGLETAHG